MDQRTWHQHDLDPSVAVTIVADAAIQSDDAVLEVGPGRGALTGALLAAGAQVAAVEIDRARAAALREQFPDQLGSGQLRLQVGDAEVLQPAFSGPWRVLANPPFNRTAALLRRWLLEDLPDGPPARLDLVLQREAAVKCLADLRGATRTSVLVALWGEATLVRDLPRTAVTPPSHVDLAVLRVVRHPDAPAAIDLQAVDRVLEVAFAGPHSVRAALRGLATPKIVARNAKDFRYRAEDHPRLVPPAAWLALATYLSSLGRV